MVCCTTLWRDGTGKGRGWKTAAIIYCWQQQHVRGRTTQLSDISSGATCVADLDSRALALTKEASGNSRGPYAYYVTLGSRCKMAISSSEDETDTFPERPTMIQPYQFEPVRQDFERVPEHRVSFKVKPMRYSMGFAKSHSLKCLLCKWAWCGAARKSARLNCINLIHFRLTAGQLHGSSCIVIPGVVCELLQFMATQ